MKKILEKINIFMIVVIILLSTMLIGTPISENNVQPVYIISGIFCGIYFIKAIVEHFKNKVDLKINILDICVLLLTFSGLISFIFRTYVSLDGAVHILFKHFCVLGLYLLTKNECKKNPKNVEIIKNAVIFSIFLLCLIGLDEINYNWFKPVKAFFKYSYVSYDEVRIGSLFSYANAMAAVAGAGFFLSLGEVFEKKKIKAKILYGAMAAVMMITLVLTYSRLVYIVFAGAAFVYSLILCKKYNVRQKITKKVLVIFGILAVLGLVYIVVGLNISDKLVLNGSYQKIIYSAKPNAEYKFQFDINDLSNAQDGFVIKISEKNEYFDDINISETKIGGSGTKEIVITTKAETSVMYVNIEATAEENYGKLEIINARLNGEKFILKYKLIPTSVVHKIQGISLKNKSVWERLGFIENALTTIKGNFLLGFGGNAWRTIQSKSQAYNSYATEAHSFPIQIFLENGILGFLSAFGIYFFMAKYLFDEVKKSEMAMGKISIIMAVGFILVHSILDFDMSFLYIMLIVFLMIATINYDKEKFKMRGEIVLYLLLIFASIGGIYVAGTERYYKKNTDILRVSKEWPEERIFEVYNKFMPFNKKARVKYYGAVADKEEVDYEKIQKILKDIIVHEKYMDLNLRLEYVKSYVEACLVASDDIYSELDFALEYIKDTEGFGKYQPNLQISRFNNLKEMVEILENAEENSMAQMFREQLEKEIAAKEVCILDFRKSRYGEKNVEQYRNLIKKINGVEDGDIGIDVDL